MDTGASSHLNDFVTNLSEVFNSCMYPSISVGDGHFIPVTNTGHCILPTSVRPLHLNNVLITPYIVKNLISVSQFVRDNNCTIEFDAYGFSVKDFMTCRVLLRCDSTEDLYPVTHPSPIPHAFLLGKHVRLPFVSSNTVVTSCFDIVHSDVWASPIPSLSGFKYYVLFLDHYSQFVWVYPLLNKSDVWSKFVLFHTYVRTQFKCEIRSFQCDHGGEFDNRNLHKLFAENGIQFRFSCPKTSQQNGKSERMVRTINNLIRTLLFQANLPPTFWVEALNMATHLLNILPSTAITNEIPYTRLFGKQPDYSLLRTFGCLCYPHLYPNHKLEPRATPSILLGHASNHRGYRCLDLHTNKIIISRHVTFDETVFPYGSTQPSSVPTYTFLDDSPDIPTQPIRSIPVLDPDTIHATHTPPPNTTPTNTNIAPSAQPESPPHATPSHNSPTQQSTTTHDTLPHIQHMHVAQQTPEIDHEQPPTAQNEIPPLIIPNPPENPNPDSVYPMVTHFRVGTNRPTERLNLHVSLVSPLPKSYRDAFSDPNCQNAMRDEYSALIKNRTWVLVPRPTNTNIVRCMWLFHHKHLADGTLSRYKARLVPNGSTQLEGVDVDETFSPVVKSGTIRTVLSLAASRHWPIHQLDVKNAFLHGDLSETVYMHQPPRFRDSKYPDHHGPDTTYLLLYVDDIVLTASSQPLLQRIIDSLHQEFSMTDLGSLNYFLGISVTRDSSGMFLSQKKYAVEILERAHMANCNPCRTPIDTESKLGNDVQQVCLHMHDPREPHLSALKRILRYVQGTLNYGLQLFSSSTTDLVAYSDADWAGCPHDSEIDFRAKYRGIANDVAKTCWLRNLLPAGQVRVLHVPSRYQFVDIFTKGLSSALFEEFRTSLSVRCPPAPTAGEC
ncbi:ribonuclease H-like domain-containing protein [Tanacetum coccineum]|uniref:Ribonuclease H-like domain-containing protein n=1 Tax=Tanacetum coccineum TaxID=301880 RepID=A0ABQ4XKB5_9ASTR